MEVSQRLGEVSIGDDIVAGLTDGKGRSVVTETVTAGRGDGRLSRDTVSCVTLAPPWAAAMAALQAALTCDWLAAMHLMMAGMPCGMALVQSRNASGAHAVRSAAV
jgi:hypothetical protein